jgi:predicted RND superfamily exporter protein
MLSKVETVQSILADDTLFSKSISMVDFMKLINMAYYGNNPEKYDLISRKDMRRLGGYVAKFEEDAFRTSRVNRYLDSLNQGNKVYLDSIYQNYPDIQSEALYVLNDGNVDSNYVLTDEALQQIKASENTKSITNKIIEQEYPMPTMAFSLKELIDTSRTTLRIRTQIKDIGSYEIAALSDSLSQKIDAALNPEKQKVEHFYSKYIEGDSTYIDSILDLSNSYYSNLTHLIAGDDEDLLFELDMDPDLLTNYYNDENFQSYMREAIDREYLSFLITGTSVVAAEGTQYLVKNLLTSLAIAIVIIAVLMSLLFQSWRMVIISLVPNFIPLLITAGIMGFFHIPIKPSTILVFSIAFGISVDDTIHFLAKYRQELKDREWDLKQCVLNALRETGVSMFYTSIVLFFGFSMFALSQFGGTQALGLLVSLTLLVAMLTNLAVLPSLLLSLENRIATKAFKEPYINIYDEEIDIDLDDLEVDPKTRKEKPDND